MVAILLNFDAAFGCSPKYKAYISVMKSDLRNLVSAEETFFELTHRHSTDLDQLGVKQSTGVTAVVVRMMGDSSYVAQATHTQLPGMTCFIYVGGTAPPGAVAHKVVEGDPWCDGTIPDALLGGRTLAASVAQPLWFVVAAFALSALLFLRQPRKRNWTVRGLVVLVFLFPMVVFSGSCGTPLLKPAVVVMALALTLFAFALRSRMVVAQAHP